MNYDQKFVFLLFPQVQLKSTMRVEGAGPYLKKIYTPKSIFTTEDKGFTNTPKYSHFTLSATNYNTVKT